MTFLLDTNTVSFLMRGEAAVRKRLAARSRTDVLLCQPVVAEIEYGLARLPRSARRNRLRGRFDLFLRELVRAPWTDHLPHSSCPQQSEDFIGTDARSGLERHRSTPFAALLTAATRRR